ncbi:MAG: tRNA uridine-5-carboxymethylaminomethyl(34) synthesis GTPase MnmE [Bacteroidota bacterium]
MVLVADTIAAIATARGRAALAVVRCSGPEAVALADRLFPSKDLAAAGSHTAHVGFVTTPEGERIDQVVVTLFRAPRSATGEDVVEVTCHGGDVAPQLILKALLDAGARLARPGEFTERAFLNGKLDLAQAEAVADLIHAQSSLAHRVSLSHLQGRYSEAVAAARQELLQTCALVELELDFAEEDVEFADKAQLEALLGRTASLLSRLLDSYRLGALVRDGVRVVIGGRPNAGKSTLLNALAGHDRAIVSPTPGTTRDEIEAEVEIGGLSFRFVDTAGLRETEDAIEAEGVRRTRDAIARADALLYVFDATLGLDAEERDWLDCFTVKRSEGRLNEAQRSEVEVEAATQPGPPILLVANKQDLLEEATDDAASSFPLFFVSARHALTDGELLDPLRSWLVDAVLGDLSDAEATPVVVNQRHRQHLGRALDAVHAAGQALATGATGETLALDLRTALHELGSITGEITNDDVLGAIFSQFCIGK